MSTFVLVGRTGNGKSSTGNSILGSRDFEPRSSTAQSREETPAIATKGHITVVDGSGIGDTGTNLMGGIERATANCEVVLNLSGRMITAFILILKYGVRFTKQEKDAIDMIKSLFGDDVFRRWGVVLMTHGDNFEMDTEEEETTFDDWCREQTGDIKTLFESCNYRCVLFNNKTSDAGKKQEQMNILLDKVNSLSNIPYTARNYQEASVNREKLRLRDQVAMIERKTKSFVEEVRNELDHAAGRFDIDGLKQLVEKVEERIAQVREKDLGTGLLQSSLNDLRMLKMNASAKLTNAKYEPRTDLPRDVWNDTLPGRANALQTLTRHPVFRLTVVITSIAFVTYFIYLIIKLVKEKDNITEIK